MIFKMFVFDTYALIEIIKGNANYKDYISSKIVINKFILTELTYWLISNYGVEIASKYIDDYADFVKDFDVGIIIKAMSFRHKHKDKRLSMTDCISYFQARELGIKFLTGDRQFENLDEVEFVK